MSEVNNENQKDNINSNVSVKEESRLNDILSVITSIIAICAALYGIISNLSNAMYAHNAESFYKVSSELFYYNRNFNFITSIVIYILTSIVLFSPFYFKEKWDKGQIDKSMAFFYSTLLALYALFFASIFFINYIVEFNLGQKSLTIIMFIAYIMLCFLFYFLITGLPKFFKKENKEREEEKEKEKDKENEQIGKKFSLGNILLYIIYVIIVIVVIIVLISRLKGPDIDPKDKKSYEILKNQVDYNVIIGYKDGMAITLTGVELRNGGSKKLKFTSNNYMLQNIEDKVIIYKTYKEVVPFGENEEKKEDQLNLERTEKINGNIVKDNSVLFLSKYDVYSDECVSKSAKDLNKFVFRAVGNGNINFYDVDVSVKDSDKKLKDNEYKLIKTDKGFCLSLTKDGINVLNENQEGIKIGYKTKLDSYIKDLDRDIIATSFNYGFNSEPLRTNKYGNSKDGKIKLSLGWDGLSDSDKNINSIFVLQEKDGDTWNDASYFATDSVKDTYYTFDGLDDGKLYRILPIISESFDSDCVRFQDGEAEIVNIKNDDDFIKPKVSIQEFDIKNPNEKRAGENVKCGIGD